MAVPKECYRNVVWSTERKVGSQMGWSTGFPELLAISDKDDAVGKKNRSSPRFFQVGQSWDDLGNNTVVEHSRRKYRINERYGLLSEKGPVFFKCVKVFVNDRVAWNPPTQGKWRRLIFLLIDQTPYERAQLDTMKRTVRYDYGWLR